MLKIFSLPKNLLLFHMFRYLILDSQLLFLFATIAELCIANYIQVINKTNGQNIFILKFLLRSATCNI